MKITLIDPEPRHARLIASSMRERDVAEIRSGWGMEPEAAMIEALRESYYARTMMRGLEPLAAFGLAPLSVLGGSARIWVFCTAAVDRHPLAFARASRRVLPEIFSICRLVTNLIDAHDTPALKWMAWLGGTCVLPMHTRGGRLFAQFILVDRTDRRRVVACQQG